MEELDFAFLFWIGLVCIAHAYGWKMFKMAVSVMTYGVTLNPSDTHGWMSSGLFWVSVVFWFLVKVW